MAAAAVAVEILTEKCQLYIVRPTGRPAVRVSVSRHRRQRLQLFCSFSFSFFLRQRLDLLRDDDDDDDDDNNEDDDGKAAPAATADGSMDKVMSKLIETSMNEWMDGWMFVRSLAWMNLD